MSRFRRESRDSLGDHAKLGKRLPTFDERIKNQKTRWESDKAINPMTPYLFGLFSLITMMAETLSKEEKLKIRSAVWDDKEVATFSDAIGCVRQQISESQSFQTSANEWEMIKIPRSFLETLPDTLCFVA
jgi:hypothetical protein